MHSKTWNILSVLALTSFVAGLSFTAAPLRAQETEDDVDAGQKKVEKKQSLLQDEKKVERKKKEDSDAWPLLLWNHRGHSPRRKTSFQLLPR